MDHNAVMKAYPNIVYLQSDFVDYGLDDSGNKVSIEQSKVDAARVELDKEKYKWQRENLYPDIRDFADAMYWNSKGDSTKLEAYYAACEKVKTDNPKPS